MGVVYADRYEFPEKKFYWCASNDFAFKPFPELNDQHREEYDKLLGLFQGDPNYVHKKVEKDPEEMEEQA